MTRLLPPHQVARDQFVHVDDQAQSHPRFLQIFLPVPAAVVAASVAIVGVDRLELGPLLTATSILTGFTFAMALRFWERSIDARKDPFLAVDGERLHQIDVLRTHLVWTVGVGTVSTLWLVIMALFASTPPPSWFGAAPVVGVTGAAFLIIYEVTLVVGALIEFYQASYSLRA